MNLKEVFGKNVKYYRFKKHITQEKLADIIGTNPNYISRLELGKHNPSLSMIDKISNALNIEPHELFIKTNPTSLPNRVDMLNKL